MPITRKSTGRMQRFGDDLFPRSAARAFGLKVRALLVLQVFRDGVGSDGARLPRYSPTYAALRSKRGLQVSPPNYTRTGRLQRATRVRQIEKRAGRTRISIGPTGHRLIVGAALNKRGAGWLNGLAPQTRPKARRALQSALRSAGGA